MLSTIFYFAASVAAASLFCWMTYTVLGSLIDMVRWLKIIHFDLLRIETRILALVPAEGHSAMTARVDADGNCEAPGATGAMSLRT